MKKTIYSLMILFAVLPLSAENLYNETTELKLPKQQSLETFGFGADGVYISQLPRKYEDNRNKSSRKNYQKGDVLLPSGIRFAYVFTLPFTSPVKDTYLYMHGGEVTYSYFFNNYLSIKTAISTTVGTRTESNAYTLQNSLSAGLNFGFPVIEIIYPYMGFAVRGVWLHEQAGATTVIVRDFGGMGADANIGIAFTLASIFGLYAEYTISLAKSFDKTFADISTMSFKAGFYFIF